MPNTTNLRKFLTTEISRQTREMRALERRVASEPWLAIQIALNKRNIAGYREELSSLAA